MGMVWVSQSDENQFLLHRPTMAALQGSTRRGGREIVIDLDHRVAAERRDRSVRTKQSSEQGNSS